LIGSLSKHASRTGVIWLAALVIVAVAYFALAPELGDLGGGDVAFFVTSVPAFLFVMAIVYATSAQLERPLLLVAACIGGAALAGALNESAPEAVAPVKCLAAAALGYLLARLIPVASIVYLLAVAVAVADAISVSVGPTEYLVEEEPEVVDYLALSMPSWGGDVSQLGVSDVVFLAVYMSTAIRFGLRVRATAISLTVALLAALALAIWTEWTIPALPLLSAGFLLPNIDLAWRGLRRDLRELDSR
jgi:hypothetical protein